MQSHDLAVVHQDVDLGQIVFRHIDDDVFLFLELVFAQS